MKNIFNISEKLKLPDNEIVAISNLRPWINAGRVGTITLNKLKNLTNAKEIGSLDDPGTFFDFTRYRPRFKYENETRKLIIPNIKIHLGHHKNKNISFLFIDLREPHYNSQLLIDSIYQFLSQSKIQEYCRIGSMYDSVPHTRPMIVSGANTSNAKLINTSNNKYQGPTSILNLLSEKLTENGVKSSTLMAHIPQYIQLDNDYFASAKVLECLAEMYDLDKSIADKSFGETQYNDFTESLKFNSELNKLVSALEKYYDSNYSEKKSDESNPDTPMSDELENFLDNISSKFEDNN
jgi:hypothetical protein